MNSATVLSVVTPILLVLVVAREIVQAGRGDFALRMNRALVLLIIPFVVLFVVMVGVFTASILFSLSGL
jgi:hypothetical protein